MGIIINLMIGFFIMICIFIANDNDKREKKIKERNKTLKEDYNFYSTFNVNDCKK